MHSIRSERMHQLNRIEYIVFFQRSQEKKLPLLRRRMLSGGQTHRRMISNQHSVFIPRKIIHPPADGLHGLLNYGISFRFSELRLDSAWQEYAGSPVQAPEYSRR